MTKILSLGLVFCLLASPALAGGSCFNPDEWAAHLGADMIRGFVFHPKPLSTEEMKQYLAIYNANPAHVAIEPDAAVLYLGHKDADVFPFALIDFFANGCRLRGIYLPLPSNQGQPA